MSKYLKYWPALLILLAFIAGRFTAPDDSQEIKKKYEQEREVMFEAIGQKDAQIIRLNEQGRDIKMKMIEDSLYFSIQRQANKRAYSALKKKYNEINLNRATPHDLDSLLSRLYPD